MFESLPLVAKHFLQEGLWLITAVCAQVLWDSSCQQPPRFQSLLQKRGGVAYLHRQESVKTWFANVKNYCVGVKRWEGC